MEFITNIYTFFIKEDGISISELFSIAKEICTILGIILGFIFGTKGIKRLLLQDIIKSKAKTVIDANMVIFQKTNELLHHLSEFVDNNNLNRVITKKEINYLNDKTRDLFKYSNGASSEIHTICFLLNRTIKDIEPSFRATIINRRKQLGDQENPKQFHLFSKQIASDFYNFIQATVYNINNLSGSIVDIPKKIKVVKDKEFKKSIKKYLDISDCSKKIKGYDFGLDTNPNNEISLTFYTLIKNYGNNFILFQKFFSILQSNTPVVYDLYLKKIYFPVILKKYKKKSLFGDEIYHLMTYKISKNLLNFKSNEMAIEFFYSSINHVLKYDISHFTNKDNLYNFTDEFLNIDFFVPTGMKVTVISDNSFKISISFSKAENYFKEVERKLKKKMKSLKKSNI